MKKSVIAIGNFDGVHLGHQDVLANARQLADKNNYDFCVLTFSPHPRQVFQPNIAPFRISNDAVKADLFANMIKPDRYKVLDFNDELHHMSADDFMDDILVKRLNAAIVIVGSDFHFGYKRSGNLQTLQAHNGFQTIAETLIEVGDDVVSSTRIRNHLKQAELEQANILLGWEWYIQSEVVHGDKRGRELGYPTANMHFIDTIVPSYGVYAVKVQIEGEDIWRNGASNMGIRPTFETKLPMVETFIFDFEGDLYGKTLKIKPIQKIRDEIKFDNLDDLIKQMDNDSVAIKSILKIA